MAIETHNALREASETDNGVLTPANSCGPSTKHFFPCNEGFGATTLTDVSKHGSSTAVVMTDTGMVWTASGSADKVELKKAASTALTGGGTWVDLAQNDSVLFWVGVPVDGGGMPPNFHTFVLGSGSISNAYVSATEAYASADNASEKVDSTGGTVLTDATGAVGAACVVDRAANTVQRKVVGSLVENDTAVDLGALTGSITPTDFFSSFGVELYGVALFVFADGLPSDLDAALAWMYTNWSTETNPMIYPGWSSI